MARTNIKREEIRTETFIPKEEIRTETVIPTETTGTLEELEKFVDNIKELETVILVKAVEPEPETKLSWKKIGGGSMRLPGRIIKPGQVFKAGLSEINVSMRKWLICLDEETLKILDGIATSPVIHEEMFSIRKTTGGYNVVSPSGKPLNGEPMTEENAKTLLQAVNS